MMRSKRLARTVFPLLSLVPLLLGCAGRQLPLPTAQTSSLNGGFETGTIVSVRNVDGSAGVGAVNQVLTALGQTPVTSQPAAVEIVIRRSDNTVTSITQPQQAGQPAFQPGEKVAIVEAASTVVHPE